ncbi:hypothetical protein Gotri_019680, partial [Gossypium trilobum]|nr:hypothetical protein [Gossypium trilobum]
MEIGGMIGKVTKLDFNTDSRVRGQYACMEVFVNLSVVVMVILKKPVHQSHKPQGQKRRMLVERKTRRGTLDGTKKGNNSKGEKIRVRLVRCIGLEVYWIRV